jgi:hypothetical protein
MNVNSIYTIKNKGTRKERMEVTLWYILAWGARASFVFPYFITENV